MARRRQISNNFCSSKYSHVSAGKGKHHSNSLLPYFSRPTGKVSPITDNVFPPGGGGGGRGIEHYSVTSVLDAAGLSTPRHVLPPGERMYRRLGRRQGRSGQVWTISGTRSPDRPARSEKVYVLCPRH